MEVLIGLKYQQNSISSLNSYGTKSFQRENEKVSQILYLGDAIKETRVESIIACLTHFEHQGPRYTVGRGKRMVDNDYEQVEWSVAMQNNIFFDY